MWKKYFCWVIYFIPIACTINQFVGIGVDKDVTVPKLTISSPQNTDYVGRNFEIVGTVIDDKGVDRVEVESAGLTKIVHKTVGKFIIPVDASSLAEGPVKFLISAYDKTEKKSVVQLNLTLDKKGPNISLFQPDEATLEGRTLVGKSIFFGMAQDDVGLGLQSPRNRFVIYKQNGSHDNDADIIFQQLLTSSSFQINGFDTMMETHLPGDYVVYLSYEDILGNFSERRWNVITAKGDKTTRVVIQSPADKSATGRLLTISGYAENAFLKIEKIKYHIIDLRTNREVIPWKDVETAYAFSETVDLQDAGLTTAMYAVEVIAFDESGASSETVISSFEYDNSLPEFQILDSSTVPAGNTPLISGYEKGDFLITLKVDTPNPDEVQYKILQNGREAVPYTDIPLKSSADGIYEAEVDARSFVSTSSIIYMQVIKNGKVREQQRVFYFDNQPPQLNILSHTDGVRVNGSVTLNGGASDNMGLSKVEIFDPKQDRWIAAEGTVIWQYLVSDDEVRGIEEIYEVVKPEIREILFKARAMDKAGNTTEKSVVLKVDPEMDEPKMVFLMPEEVAGGIKVSGALSVICTMDDDDYPRKPMTAEMRVYKYPKASYPTPVLRRSFDKNSAGFPNLSYVIDTESLEDMTRYTIEFDGSAWKNKKSATVSRDFIVDKNVPTIELTGGSGNDAYLTGKIVFEGKVRDKGELAGETPLAFSFVDSTGANQEGSVQLTPAAKEGEYNVWTFAVTLNHNGVHSGFVTPVPVISWGDDEWGNNAKTFTFRATDETGLMGYQYVKVNLDNHRPEATITNPPSGYIIADNSELPIRFTVDDNPKNGGKPYKLTFKENVKIELYERNSLQSVIKAYGAGKDDAITGEYTYVWNHSTLPQGLNYELRLTVKDNAGNESVVSSVPFIKNNYPPLIESITLEEKSYYKGDVNINVLARDRGTTVEGNGVKKIEIFLKNEATGAIETLKEMTYSGSNLSETCQCILDTTTKTDGVYIISAAVTDTTNIKKNSDFAKTIYIDNTPPKLDLITYQSMGSTNSDVVPIDRWTAYLGLTINVSDAVSLMGDTPQIRIGTSEGGDDVLAATYLTARMNGNNKYTAVYDNWIELFEVLADNYASTSTLHVTVNMRDAAGNTREVRETIQKGTLPSGGFRDPPGTWYKANASGLVEIPGSVGAGSDQAWISVNQGDWKALTITGGTNFTAQFSSSDFILGGEYNFRLRVKKGADQNIVARKFCVDTVLPEIAITQISAVSSAEGNVDGSRRVSGKIRIAGTYKDNFADKLASVSAAQLKIKIGESVKDIPISNITRGYGGSAWEWFYQWDTEDVSLLPKITAEDVIVRITCADIAGNGKETTKELDVVPYVTSLTAKDDNKVVAPVRYSKNNQWGNHKAYKKYSAGQGTALYIHGFNLKQGSTSPAVTLNNSSLTLTSSSKNRLEFTVGTGHSSGDLKVAVNGIASDPVYLNVWKFSLLGRNGTNREDTLDAEGYDMDLLSDDKVFVTFARNHKVGSDYNEKDYAAYFYYEGKTDKAYNFSILESNESNIVDPVFYAAFAKVSDTQFHATFTYDEWGGREYTRKMTITIGEEDSANGNVGIRGSSNNCNKKARVIYNGNNRLYFAYYNDDSRAATPSPYLTFLSTTLTNGGTVVEVDNGGEYFDLAAVNGNPVLVYYKQGSLYSAYAAGTDTSTLSGKNRIISSDEGKYCKIVPYGTNGVHLAYQDGNSNLVYRRISGSAFTSVTTKVILEASSTVIDGASEGISGFNSSIALDRNSLPRISYLNNSKLNTKEALRFARSASSTTTSQNDWEYMVVPSPVQVNGGSTILKIDSANRPVILYKGDNCLYVARLVE